MEFVKGIRRDLINAVCVVDWVCPLPVFVIVLLYQTEHLPSDAMGNVGMNRKSLTSVGFVEDLDYHKPESAIASLFLTVKT